ncbi:MAG: hypothetical protein IT303_15905 [Dehalococcoidia bacterium]|nr:hypothetical protein [Dehalococcoidia bacterium]
MPGRTYPAEPAEAALRLFLRWFGATYARATRVGSEERTGHGIAATVGVGRQWTLALAVLDTLRPETNVAWEAARAALEQRLDGAGHSVVLWVPRGAALPMGEPDVSEFVLGLDAAAQLEDGRKELRLPVELYLRRTSTTGSVLSILGGLAASWAQFTNRVPGSFQLNSLELMRMPARQSERDELAERIVLAAGQPDVDDSVTITAEDAWTVNDLGEGGSYVLGSPEYETDEQSAALRRNLRQLLREASPTLGVQADARALVVLGSATYAEDEKLSWALRGMDPSLYAGYDLIVVIADGVVKPLLRPGPSTLVWDVPPLPGRA